VSSTATQVTALSATQLAAAIRERRISSREVVEAHLRRIDEVNPRLRAVVALDGDASLAAADAADAALARGEAAGPLHGVPFTVKDWLDAAGLPCAAGVEARSGFVPKHDATAVARLRAAGAILLGKTKPGNDDAVYPHPRNPYDLARTPGGSSGGEAAIVAAGGSPLGLGSDSGGSLRFPAHCCGVVTVKPQAGRVPRTGHVPRIGHLSDPRTQVGPVARSVEDAALALSLIAGEDGRDPQVAPVPLGDYRDVALAGLRLAWFTSFEGATPDAATRSAVDAAARALASAGAHVEEALPPRIEEARAITEVYWSRARSYSHTAWQREDDARALPGAEAIERSIFGWERLHRDMTVFMQRFDAIVSPACPYPAPLLGGQRAEDFIYTLPWSLTGWPCTVVRAASSAQGLPIGIQFVAAPWRDDVALVLAAFVEEASGGFQPPPI
jgi:amidase